MTRTLDQPFKMGKARVLGRPVTRLEDPPLLAGKGRFINNLAFPGQLHMRVVRSDVAHGRIAAIDIAQAKSAPGVLAVWTSADIADFGPIDFRDPSAEQLSPYRQPLLARTRVRYVGEPIAVVFADNPYRAEDAAELVVAQIEPLPVQLEAAAAPVDFGGGASTEAIVLHGQDLARVIRKHLLKIVEESEKIDHILDSPPKPLTQENTDG